MTGDIPRGGYGTKNVAEHYDFDDPFFLHPLDNGTISIISIKLTCPENFRIWRSSMIRALKGWKKLGFVDKSFAEPTNDEIKSRKWEKVNDVLCSWLLGSIFESLYASHACSETASVIWTELFET